jgi:hypothetical protein
MNTGEQRKNNEIGLNYKIAITKRRNQGNVEQKQTIRWKWARRNRGFRGDDGWEA